MPDIVNKAAAMRLSWLASQRAARIACSGRMPVAASALDERCFFNGGESAFPPTRYVLSRDSRGAASVPPEEIATGRSEYGLALIARDPTLIAILSADCTQFPLAVKARGSCS